MTMLVIDKNRLDGLRKHAWYKMGLQPMSDVDSAYNRALDDVCALGTGLDPEPPGTAETPGLLQQRDELLRALEALLEHEGTVDVTGIGELPSEALQQARAQAEAVIATVKASQAAAGVPAEQAG